MKIAAASLIVALTTISCSAASERELIDQFFTASRLRDRTALARFSTVVFEPRSDGIVEEFVVLGATPARELDDRQSGAGVAADERRLVISLSLADPTDPVDLTTLGSVVLEKDVTVTARVETADGTEVTRAIVVTLQQAGVDSQDDNRRRVGRWIVVRFAY
jgi:hypothetical protein